MSINLEITASPQCVTQPAFIMMDYLVHIGTEPRHARILESFIIIMKPSYSLTYRVLIKTKNSRLEEMTIQKLFLSFYGGCKNTVAFYKEFVFCFAISAACSYISYVYKIFSDPHCRYSRNSVNAQLISEQHIILSSK
jgi:hypothetical protein